MFRDNQSFSKDTCMVFILWSLIKKLSLYTENIGRSIVKSAVKEEGYGSKIQNI